MFDKDKGYYLDFLITSNSLNTNYKVDFHYDYFYYRKIENVKLHTHKYDMNIQNNNNHLSDETKSIYQIYLDNIKPKYIEDGAFNDFKFINDYSEDILNCLLEFDGGSFIKNIRLSYLQPIITNERTDIPFAYKKTVSINVPMISGKIFVNDVIYALKTEGYIDDISSDNLLKIFNSNLKVKDTLDEVPSSSPDKSEYMFSYYTTYDIHLKSSSGNVENFSIGIESMTDYYSSFCVGSGSEFEILDTESFEVIFNSILNCYGLSGYKIPDGLNKGSNLTASDLYGYWGFALIPEGGGFNDLLSKFFDSRANSNGLAFPFYSTVTLSKSSSLALQNKFGYSWLSRTLKDFTNLLDNTTANATYYVFYVSEISNEYIYVISENGQLGLLENSSILNQKTSSAIKSVSKIFKNITSKIMNLLNNPLYLFIIICAVVLFIGIYVIAKLFKK